MRMYYKKQDVMPKKTRRGNDGTGDDGDVRLYNEEGNEVGERVCRRLVSMCI